jgi:TrmH family RNA methyltransferase
LFSVITSPDNSKLKAIRKLASRRERDRSGLFAAEGEDLVAAAEAAGVEPEYVLVGGEDVAAELLDAVSALGSGTRVIGVYRQRWAEPNGDLRVYLHGVGDPGNVGAVVRSTHALADGNVVLGPGCADPYSPKAVRASTGSIFARPPARAGFSDLSGMRIALDSAAPDALATVEPKPPVTVCVGAEREGLPAEIADSAERYVRIPLAPGAPDSLNAAMAATVALYDLGNRMARHA